jgi:hypothetical protein
MSNLSSLQKKRADLCAAREQYVGQINRTNGAIDLLDDLILEHKAAEEEEEALAVLSSYDIAPIPMSETYSGFALEAPLAQSLAPQMLPVTYDAPAEDPA